ncbi:MAG: CSLREA domain-containing protein, partial [Anaerolineales bacterium]
MKGFLQKGVFLLLFLMVAAALSPAPAEALLVQYAVNSIQDHDDGSCPAEDCTLREAILGANADGQDSLIRFNIPGSGPYVITVASRLPFLAEDGTVIDGTAQPGYGPDPVVVLAGDSIETVSVGLEIRASHCTVRGLSL